MDFLGFLGSYRPMITFWPSTMLMPLPGRERRRPVMSYIELMLLVPSTVFSLTPVEPSGVPKYSKVKWSNLQSLLV